MVDVKRPLYRLPKQGKIAGVCAGLADYFDFDVTLMRVIFVVGGFITGGAAILLYIILAIVLPVSNSTIGSAKAHIVDDEKIGEKFERLGRDLQDNGSVNRMRNYLGAGLALFGVWLLLSQLFPQWGIFRWEFVWPAILIVIGILIVVKRSGK
ncbi:MAG: PspC domain-containing protein [Candidatus Saccharibacteria bacterium]